mmetsp:Transcript_59679/g.163610  ORF Transcript_59679/g.163610 Transcript_59679/m.163610 type:complete len:329 (+) Transcript_59679:400-1386(+)
MGARNDRGARRHRAQEWCEDRAALRPRLRAVGPDHDGARAGAQKGRRPARSRRIVGQDPLGAVGGDARDGARHHERRATQKVGARVRPAAQDGRRLQGRRVADGEERGARHRRGRRQRARLLRHGQRERGDGQAVERAAALRRERHVPRGPGVQLAGQGAQGRAGAARALPRAQVTAADQARALRRLAAQAGRGAVGGGDAQRLPQRDGQGTRHRRRLRLGDADLPDRPGLQGHRADGRRGRPRARSRGGARAVARRRAHACLVPGRGAARAPAGHRQHPHPEQRAAHQVSRGHTPAGTAGRSRPGGSGREIRGVGDTRGPGRCVGGA